MFNEVVVGVDGRAGGRDAILLAKLLASPEAHITLAHVYGGQVVGGRGSAIALNRDRKEAEQLLALERLDASIEADAEVKLAGSVGRGLHELAERHRADLLVVGSCSRGIVGRVVLGDDMRDSLNGAPCAVAIAPQGYADVATPLRRIGIGYDDSPESHQALMAARELASRHGSKISALSVVSLQSLDGEPIPDDWPKVAKQLIDDELRRFKDVPDVEGDATYGEPSEELARFGDELDLMIVGSRGYGPIGRLFNGSTSNYLARRARCALLVLPRGKSVTPVPKTPASESDHTTPVPS